MEHLEEAKEAAAGGTDGVVTDAFIVAQRFAKYNVHMANAWTYHCQAVALRVYGQFDLARQAVWDRESERAKAYRALEGKDDDL